MLTLETPRTGRKTSMPPRGRAPGLKRGRHNLPYWMAKQVVRDPRGYPDPCVPLPPDADDEELARLCHEHTAALRKWIEDQDREAADPDDSPMARAAAEALRLYDGSVRSACQVYQKHPMSRFHKVKRNTRKSYSDSLKVIELTVGRRLIRNLTVIDHEHWYSEWKKPVVMVDKQGHKTPGPERVDRAHDAISMWRTVLRFMAALRKPECKLLADELAAVKFEKGGAREQELTYAHVTAFIRKALELGAGGVIPDSRARSMAIGTAAQFELMLRQKDIIGEWSRSQADAGRLKVDPIAIGDEFWSGFFTWERVPGWRWRMKTSKSKYRAAADFDLTRYDLLYPLLEAVPAAERVGAIVKDETGKPVRERSYRKWFRQIARAAGLPDEVWNMDSRAGGATEADEAGADIEAIRDALTHEKTGTTLRYLRRRSTKIAMVADARSQKRASDNEGGTP
jgi:hypothetical protein